MKKMVVLWCALFAMALVGATSAGETKGTGALKVSVSGFDNDRGDMKIAIFNSADSYSKGPEGFRMAAVPIRGGRAEWTLNDLPFGDYAVKAYHDENGNGKLDKNAVGMPKEKYGFSNNARGSFGPPGYDKARFSFDKTGMAIAMTVE